MAGPENTFIASVHRHLPPESALHREGMHNVYRGGTADMWYSGTAADLWVEYKFIVVPKRDDTAIDLTGGKDSIISGLQQEWLKSRLREGRNVWVIVGCKAGGAIFRGNEWARKRPAGEFKGLIQDRKTIAERIASFTLGAP